MTSSGVHVIDNHFSRFNFLQAANNIQSKKTMQVYIRLKLYKVVGVMFEAVRAKSNF